MLTHRLSSLVRPDVEADLVEAEYNHCLGCCIGQMILDRKALNLRAGKPRAIGIDSAIVKYYNVRNTASEQGENGHLKRTH